MCGETRKGETADPSSYPFQPPFLLLDCRSLTETRFATSFDREGREQGCTCLVVMAQRVPLALLHPSATTTKRYDALTTLMTLAGFDLLQFPSLSSSRPPSSPLLPTSSDPPFPTLLFSSLCGLTKEALRAKCPAWILLGRSYKNGIGQRSIIAIHSYTLSRVDISLDLIVQDPVTHYTHHIHYSTSTSIFFTTSFQPPEQVLGILHST